MIHLAIYELWSATDILIPCRRKWAEYFKLGLIQENLNCVATNLRI